MEQLKKLFKEYKNSIKWDFVAFYYVLFLIVCTIGCIQNGFSILSYILVTLFTIFLTIIAWLRTKYFM